MSERLGEMLVAAGVLGDEQLRAALAHQRGKGQRLGEALIELGLVDEITVTRALAKQAGLPFLDLSKGRIPAALLARVPAELAREQGILPALERGGALILAIDDPLKRYALDALGFQIGAELKAALSPPSQVAKLLAEHYGAPQPEAKAAAKAGAESDDAPVVRLVSRTFQDALNQRASDIHLEPMAAGLRVRFRVDGVLRIVAEHPPHLSAPLLSRLKVMGSMDIAEKRKPQDGRIQLDIAGRNIDVRASILPSNHGETMVLRLLDRSANLIGLPELGFQADDNAWFQRLIKRPNGIVLVTGPTGSGKTTTLYAALSALNRPDTKIITAEDPVEYHLRGVNQMQVNPRVGLTFSRILKAMLRAAPNIILVGEIRDLETAEVAIQAALTGHLVFSTLHTNDAPSALTRLVDMGVQPFLVSAAVQGVLAQRLVRRLCPECNEAYTPDPSELRALGIDPAQAPGAKLARPKGCRVCDGNGYKGRVGLFEMLELDAELREVVYQRSGVERLRELALARGKLRALLVDGARKALARQTSLAEVLRVCRAAGGDLVHLDESDAVEPAETTSGS
ncbi:MAG: type II/IV secretion system protein [Planctomycetaceae bacterium]|nr:type II/IV secretion system protein [Planctomycetaceae bacterium]